MSFKLSEKLPVVESPSKSNKCKNFLVSILSPSASKKSKSSKKKLFKQSHDSQEVNHPVKIYKTSLPSDDLNEPIYSDIHISSDSFNLPSTSTYKKFQEFEESSIRTKSSSVSKKSTSTAVNDPGLHEKSVISVKSEPVYATVDKRQKGSDDQSTNSEMHKSQIAEYSEGGEKTALKEISNHYKGSSCISHSLTLPKVGESETDEDVKILQHRLKELSEDNRKLQKHVQNLMMEEKWKDSQVHAELQLKITELEAETRREVKSLSDNIQILTRERRVMSEQIHSLHEEKKTLQTEYNNLLQRTKSMISPEEYKRTSDAHKRLLNEEQKKHQEEISKLKQQYDALNETKNFLAIQIEDMQDKLTMLESKNEDLEKSNEKFLLEKNQLLQQLEDIKDSEHGAKSILHSLLEVVTFEDFRQKQVQSTLVNYSLNIGRLQEHISNLSKEKLEELFNLKISQAQYDETLKQVYGKQFDTLREKIINQNNTISVLQNEKSKLELQLESVWQATCGSNLKPLQQVNNHFPITKY
ncbi:hyaluronan mediated motility receptor-like isoform X2 [Stegodyphus dumicola]|uniref:hyaluronan mediated motility receptor-like isoform X2 n=1 Tax=Stegodyphus dumicola TaxID=202533 RepID=UPI0015B00B0A|nr:hyaluronan mediated motility receptor-like isoform X2 [Stegodyphus dumicola]